nr:hypothetical protein Q903MT_gene6610 [Picea sitchensis]
MNKPVRSGEDGTSSGLNKIFMSIPRAGQWVLQRLVHSTPHNMVGTELLYWPVPWKSRGAFYILLYYPSVRYWEAF